jgi:hypothetical protein
MSFRDIKRQARGDLHEILRIPVRYLTAVDDVGVDTFARVQTKFDALGLAGAEDGLAKRREIQPKIIFMRHELANASIVPKKNDIVSVEPGEAYRLDNADAPDDVTVTWFVSVLSETKAAGLPLPGDA